MKLSTTLIASLFVIFSAKAEIGKEANIQSESLPKLETLSSGVLDIGGGHSIDGVLLDDVLFGHLYNFRPDQHEAYFKYTQLVLDKIDTMIPRFGSELREGLFKNEWIMSNNSLSLKDCPMPEAQLKTTSNLDDLVLVACQDTNTKSVTVSAREFKIRSIEFQGKLILHELIRHVAHKRKIDKKYIYSLYNKLMNLESLSAEQLASYLNRIGLGKYSIYEEVYSDITQGQWQNEEVELSSHSYQLSLNENNIKDRFTCSHFKVSNSQYLHRRGKKIDQITFCNDDLKGDDYLTAFKKISNNKIMQYEFRNYGAFLDTTIEYGEVETSVTGEAMFTIKATENDVHIRYASIDPGMEDGELTCKTINAKNLAGSSIEKVERIFECNNFNNDPNDTIILKISKERGLKRLRAYLFSSFEEGIELIKKN